MSRRSTREAEMALVRAVLRREPGAWEKFYKKYHRLMASCIRRVYHKHGVNPDSEEMEDLMAQVCLNLVDKDFRKLRMYDPERGHRLSSWVGLISANTAYDALRRRAPEHVSLDDPDTGVAATTPARDPSPLDHVEAEERRELLRRAVSQLTESERRFVYLFYQSRLEPQEVARQLGVKVSTVYSRKNKVKAKLLRIVSELLGVEGRDPESGSY